jgi:hypothetical protein
MELLRSSRSDRGELTTALPDVATPKRRPVPNTGGQVGKQALSPANQPGG